ncbi:hypothetical protein MWU53_11125 [Aliiroseovarius sp. S1123]|nr:hypothetical protein [Aliiroseovarius sp. S1123]MCK0171611.1 hypothetical protein [Aliiroseovarius sp. S1123]
MDKYWFGEIKPVPIASTFDSGRAALYIGKLGGFTVLLVIEVKWNSLD